MTPTKEITEVFKDVPIASSLSGLLNLFVNSSGALAKTDPLNLIIYLFAQLCKSALKITNIDEAISPGLYQMSNVVEGTLPDIPISGYGHLLVLVRENTVQQIYFGRNGIALRFKITSDPWPSWKVLIATL